MMSIATTPRSAAEQSVGVAFNVLRLLDRPTSTSNQIAEAVDQDPGLSKQILKMARSPLCGVRSPDLTVARAVVLLGFITVRKLVVVSLCRDLGSMNNDDGGRWRHALWVGIAAEEITRRIDEAAASEALMIGMMRYVSAGNPDAMDESLKVSADIDPARLDKFLAGAERVADLIVSARPALPSTSDIDTALEESGLMPMEDGKLAVDIRRGYELYASLLS